MDRNELALVSRCLSPSFLSDALQSLVGEPLPSRCQLDNGEVQGARADSVKNLITLRLNAYQKTIIVLKAGLRVEIVRELFSFPSVVEMYAERVGERSRSLSLVIRTIKA